MWSIVACVTCRSGFEKCSPTYKHVYEVFFAEASSNTGEGLGTRHFHAWSSLQRVHLSTPHVWTQKAHSDMICASTPEKFATPTNFHNLALPPDRFEMFLTLSDELQMLIVKAVSFSALGNLRLTCRKMNALAQACLFKELYIPVEEDHLSSSPNLKVMPSQIRLATSLTILNRPKPIWASDWYDNVVPRRGTTRVHRWHLLDGATENLSYTFLESALYTGSQFNWDVKLRPQQLHTFRWLHAIPLAAEVGMIEILIKQAPSLKHLEISMIESTMVTEAVKNFTNIVTQHDFRLETFAYRGLSYTEPSPPHGRSAEGKFRMIRPLMKNSLGALRSLILTQEHCISQIGRTPLVDGHVFEGTLCDLDEIYVSPSRAIAQEAILLPLTTLELGGFEISRLASAASMLLGPKVRIDVPNLRRLVLSDCEGADSFLTDLVSRPFLKQVHLKEFGVRFETDTATPSRRRAAAAVVRFLTSFTGLETLSIMCKKPFEVNLSRQILRRHQDTLKVLVNDARAATRSEFQSAHPFVEQPRGSSKTWARLFAGGTAKSVVPNLQEISLSLKQNLEAVTLEYLVGHRSLRTVHVRNFVPLEDALQANGKVNLSHWRELDGSVSPQATDAARIMIETIALRPVDAGEPNSGEPRTTPTEVGDLVRRNMLHRYNELFGTSHSSQPPASDTFSNSWLDSRTRLPKDIASRVAKHKSEHDTEFELLMADILNGVASAEDYQRYQSFTTHVQHCLNILPSLERPRLQLLVVGDWRYRDRFNLAGPRSWDPDAWYDSKDIKTCEVGPSLQDEEEEVGDERHNMMSWHGHNYKFCTSFERHSSILLVPIFFKIDWRQEENSAARWEWKATPEPIEYSAVKDDGDFAIKSLDFAWQS